MFAEREARFPKGTYKVLCARQDGSIQYLVQNLCTGKQYLFLGAWGMVKGIESDLSDNKHPQCAIKYRSWGILPQTNGTEGKNKAAERTGAIALADAQAFEATFLLKVLYRQNATWQGTVQWMEGRQARDYRSVNELLLLMDDALDYSAEMRTQQVKKKKQA